MSYFENLIRSTWPEHFGKVVHVHTIGEHFIVEYFPQNKQKYREIDGKYSKVPGFMVWNAREEKLVTPAEATLDDALVLSVAVRKGNQSAGYYARKVLGLAV